MAKMQNRNAFFMERNGVITIQNRKRVILEGVERIIFCDSEKMIIKNRFVTRISGRGLHLMELGNQNIAIIGEIDSLHFDKGIK